MFKTKSLFEIPVYRISRQEYYEERNNYVSNINSKLICPLDTKFLHDQYGGDWEYNEIIGFIKLFQYGGNQLRCEYHETIAKRKIRTRTKVFAKVSDKYCERKFSNNCSNNDLIKIVKDCIDHCTVRLKKRYVDVEIFSNMVEHISWDVLLKK